MSFLMFLKKFLQLKGSFHILIHTYIHIHTHTHINSGSEGI